MTWSDILWTLLLGYSPPMEMVDKRFPIFLQSSGGLVLTVLITAASIVLGFIAGFGLALCRREVIAPRGRRDLARRLLGRCSAVIVETVRGLPIIVIVLSCFYLPYPLLGLRIPSGILAVIAFALYSSAYFSEIFRGGFRGISLDLRDAGKVLGMPSWAILLRIEMPLVIRRTAPDCVNVMVTVFKDSAALAIVGVPELTYVGRQMLTSEPRMYGSLTFLILVLYWLPATIFSALAFYKERRSEGAGNGRATM